MPEKKSPDQLLADILIDKGWLDQAQVDASIKDYRQATQLGVKTTLLQFLVDKGLIDKAQAAEARKQLVRSGIHPKLGNYELIEKIGEGGMGTVYKAIHPRLKTTVAVKLLQAHVAKDEKRLARFKREAQLAARLMNVDIVHVLDVQEAEGRHFIVMEYVDGESLEDIMLRGQMGEAEALRILRDVARTLAVLHKNEIVHRDVKPANILINTEGRAKLADLGIAKTLSAEDATLTQIGTAIGTPAYASPEQTQDAKYVDHRSDIYSLGATFYHMATGVLPFEGQTPVQIMMKHAREPLRDPVEVNPEIRRGTADLICQMMEKDPEKRIQSCAAVAKIADALLSSLDSGTPMPAGAPAAERKRPPWKLIGAIGGGVAILAIVAVLLLIGGDEPPPPKDKQVAVAPPSGTRPSKPPVAGQPTGKEPSPPTTGTQPMPPTKSPEVIKPPVTTPVTPPTPAPEMPKVEQPVLPTAAELAEERRQAFLKRVRIECFDSTPQIRDMAFTKDHAWAATQVGAARIDLKTGKVEEFRHRDGFPSPGAHNVAIDTQGNVWFGALRDAAVIQYNGKQFIRHTTKSLVRKTCTVLAARKGRVWWFGSGGDEKPEYWEGGKWHTQADAPAMFVRAAAEAPDGAL